MRTTSFITVAVLLVLAFASAGAQVDHFAIALSGGGSIPTETAGIPFFIQVLAQDSTNGTVTSFNGTVDVSSNGTLSTGSGTTPAFSNGVLGSYEIVFSGAGTETLFVKETGGTATGKSNAFLVVLPPLPLHHFAVALAGGGTIPTETSGVPFFIEVLAQDSTNGTVTSFTGTVDVSSNRTLTQGTGTTPAFVNGVLGSYEIIPASAGAETLFVQETGGTITGRSNPYLVVNPVPVLTGISPARKVVGDTNFVLTITGSGFLPLSVASVDGNARTTTYVTGDTLRAEILASDLASAGSRLVTVVNPGPGGGTSNPETLHVANPVMHLKVFLEAAYQNGTMNTTLRTSNLVPAGQPYSVSPWSYNGTEHAASLPSSVVDWVLVELRTGTASGTTIARRAALLNSNGTVTDTDGVSPLVFPSVRRGSYYTVIRHRNHLAVMSAVPVQLDTNSALYDFTSDVTRYYGSDAKSLAPGVWGMYAGDYSADGFVDVTDYSGPSNTMFQSGYLQSDLSMDGFVDVTDYVQTSNNYFKGTNVPN